jgi:hypothetical protein
MASGCRRGLRAVAFGCIAAVLQISQATLAQTPSPLPEGEGREKFLAACANCHEMSVVVAQGRSRDEWGTMISTMIDRGAQVADVDFAAIQDYLARFFPAKAASAQAGN